MGTTPVPAPVTVLITRRVRRGRTAEFERLMAGMQASAALFPGHMGGFLIPPERGEDNYWRMLFAFDTAAHSESRERQGWLRQIAGVTHGAAATRVMTGLETWFALPAARTRAPPPRWKMVIVSWTGIFPLVLLASHTLTPWFALARMPSLLATFLVTGAITVAMTWLVMPTLARVFADWLYPTASEADPHADHPPEDA